MKEKNIRVYLGGHGGDETISQGKGYLKDLFVMFKWKKLIREINGYSKRANKNVTNIFINEVLFPSIPLFIKNFLYKILSYFREHNENKIILSKELSELYAHHSIFNSILFQSNAKKAHYFDIYEVANQETLEMLDKSVAAFSIEPRYPFFDKRLVEFCYGIPAEMKFRNGWNRYIQRIAMDNILPKSIQFRPLKKFFTSVYQRNLFLYENEYLDQIFNNKNAMTKSYINTKSLKNSYKNYSMGKGNKHSNKNIWLVTLLDLWLKNLK